MSDKVVPHARHNALHWNGGKYRALLVIDTAEGPENVNVEEVWKQDHLHTHFVDTLQLLAPCSRWNLGHELAVPLLVPAVGKLIFCACAVPLPLEVKLVIAAHLTHMVQNTAAEPGTRADGLSAPVLDIRSNRQNLQEIRGGGWSQEYQLRHLAHVVVPLVLAQVHTLRFHPAGRQDVLHQRLCRFDAMLGHHKEVIKERVSIFKRMERLRQQVQQRPGISAAWKGCYFQG
mmetsp:Transcript_26499/g.61826  ORF Transcript_26499/g.61826 Transcript_26499/m.61826 type:complete len:231 (+) Transcript_26499:1715-2407(+)